MPKYGDLPSAVGATGQLATMLVPGDALTLFNAETLTAPQASIAISIGPAVGGGYAPLTFDIEFAAAPTATVAIQGAMNDVDSAYQTLYTSTSLQQDNYADYGKFRFYRAKLLTQSAGGALTVTVSR